MTDFEREYGPDVYRCSACDGVTAVTSKVIKQWAKDGDYSNSDVCICRPCSIKMRKAKIRYVGEYNDFLARKK